MKDIKEKLLLKIKKEFPKLKWQLAEQNKIGWDYYIVVLDNRLIFRFAKDKLAHKILADEIDFLKFLQGKVKLKIPNYCYISRDKSFVGYETIPGEHFMPWVYHKYVPKKNKLAMAKQLGEFISTMQATPIKKIKNSTIKNAHLKIYNIEPKVYQDLWLKFNQADKNFARKFFAIRKKYNKYKYQRVLVHGDLWKENVIIQHDYKRLAGVIDFSDRHLGDPAQEFAGFWDYGPQFVKNVYKNYTGAKDNEFLERSFLYYLEEGFWMLWGSLKTKNIPYKKAYEFFQHRINKYSKFYAVLHSMEDKL